MIVDDLIVVDALSLAEKAGNAKAVNVVLMGLGPFCWGQG